MAACAPPCSQQSPEVSEIRPGMLMWPAKSPHILSVLCPHFDVSTDLCGADSPKELMQFLLINGNWGVEAGELFKCKASSPGIHSEVPGKPGLDSEIQKVFKKKKKAKQITLVSSHHASLRT